MRISPISDYLPGGLLATYWDTTGSKVRCIDPEINHNWKTGSPNLKIHNDCFTARWEGKLKVDKSDEYTLYTLVDDGVRVWVDGKVLIDCSRDNVEREDNAKISLTEGLHDIVMEYNENYAGAAAKLLWSSSSMSKRIISSANLYSPTQIANNVSPLDDLAVSINKRVGQPGWEDIVEQVSVAGTGYKRLDYNQDNRVDIKDLRMVSPELQDTLEQINNNIGKKKDDSGWEDIYQDEKRHKLVWRRLRPRWEEYTVQQLVSEGAKRLDLNRDNKINTDDIFFLWAERGNPEVKLDFLKKAFNHTSGELNWDDLFRPIIVKGAKNWDFTVDGQVNKDDLLMYFAAMYKNGTVIQAKGDNNLYVMMNGEKIFVPDKQILEVLSLDKSGITIVESKEMELISTNYMDGTILKDEAGKSYLMENGYRRPVERNTLRKLGMLDGYTVDIKSSKAPALGADIQPISYEPNKVLRSIENGRLYLTTLDKGVKVVDGIGYTDYNIQKIGIPDKMTQDALGLGKDTTISIRAKGDASKGTYPLIQLRIDGQVVKEWFVTGNWAEYSVTLPLSNGKHNIDVVYSNDQDIETRINTWEEKTGKWYNRKTIVHTDTVHNVVADRTLWVDSIRVSDVPIQAEDVSRVKYDRGESYKLASYLDGKDLTTAAEKMEWAGALRFTADVNNEIPMLDKELSDIPDVKRLVVDENGDVIVKNNAPVLETVSIDKILYANGTVLRADNRLYLVSSGMGREIKDDEITLTTLGIDKGKIVDVSVDSLPVISNEPALEVRHSNGTILKGSSDRYYLCQAGAKMLIPDKTTFEAMGLYQNDVSSITIRARADVGEQAPNMKLLIDGKMIKEWAINHTDWQDYVVELPDDLRNGEHKIDVVFDNDHYREYQEGRRRHRRTVRLDTNLYVDNIQIRDVRGTKTIQAEDASVSYDRGRNNDLASYQDGQDVIAGQEGMLWSGALRFKANIEPIHNLSKEEMSKIPEVAPLPVIKYANKTLVKGTGDTVYMIMAGRKLAVPGGETTYNAYELDGNKVIQITDEELAALPTDDGLERIEYHDTQVHKHKILQRLLSAAIKFIPVVGQIYTGISALAGKDLITNDKMSGADIGLGLLGGFGSWAKAASGTGKIANIAKLGKDATSVGKLIKAGTVAGDIAGFASDFRTITTMGFGVDPFTGQKASSSSRLLSGLSFLGSNMWDGMNGAKIGKLSTSQVAGLSNLYRAGAMLDRGVSDIEKENLAISGVSSYLGSAIGVAATQGVKTGVKELGRFGTDMAAGIKVGSEFSKDIASYAAKAYSATSHKVRNTVDAIFAQIREKQDTQTKRLSEATGKDINDIQGFVKERWGVEGVIGLEEAIKSAETNDPYANVYATIGGYGDVANLNIPKMGQSTTGVNDGNNAEFRKEIEKVKDIVRQVVTTAKDLTTDAGKEVVVHEAVQALEKAGYKLAASILSKSATILGPAFDITSVGDPTDVAGLLRRQGEKFIGKEEWKLLQQKESSYNPFYTDEWYSEQRFFIEKATKDAIGNYLTNQIKYDNKPENRLVFPDTKFEFKLYHTLEGRIKVIVEPK